MQKQLVLLITLCCLVSQLNAQKYFISFTDKDDNGYSINQPELFLSQRAIDRRARHNISITKEDLPVTKAYVDSVRNMGITIYWPSKWLNGVIVESDNTELIDTISRVSFINNARLIWKPTTTSAFKSKDNYKVFAPDPELKSTSEYGLAWNQTNTVNGQHLHENKFEGDDIIIAVIDNGFENVDNLPSFEHLWDNNQILNVVNFVHPNEDVFVNSGDHGMAVLSVMGGYIESQFKGSAPKASYLLLRSEDNDSEYPIEEYNWVCAAEFADSSGADVINSSLGYYKFDDSSMDYTYEDMDGQSTISVKGAETAFSKGILVVNSAGNEGDKSWRYIITPSDGANVLAIAAMQNDTTRAAFSSYGPSADNRTKPDLTAIGEETALQDTDGTISTGNGTSFSGPVVAGFMACLWQAKPELTNIELLSVIKRSAHQYDHPDDSFGYGVPDFKAALDINSAVTNVQSSSPYKIKPNPFNNELIITHSSSNFSSAKVELFNITGTLIYTHTFINQETILLNQLDALQVGIYLLSINDGTNHYTFKLIKK